MFEVFNQVCAISIVDKGRLPRPKDDWSNLNFSIEVGPWQEPDL
jgi:hypothetical protein